MKNYAQNSFIKPKPYAKPPEPGLSLTAGVQLDPLAPLPGVPSILESLEKLERQRQDVEEMSRTQVSAIVGADARAGASRAVDDASMQEIKLALLKISGAQEALSQNVAQLTKTVAELSKNAGSAPRAQGGGAAGLGPDATPSDWANHQVFLSSSPHHPPTLHPSLPPALLTCVYTRTNAHARSHARAHRRTVISSAAQQREAAFAPKQASVSRLRWFICSIDVQQDITRRRGWASPLRIGEFRPISLRMLMLAPHPCSLSPTRHVLSPVLARLCRACAGGSLEAEKTLVADAGDT